MKRLFYLIAFLCFICTISACNKRELKNVFEHTAGRPTSTRQTTAEKRKEALDKHRNIDNNDVPTSYNNNSEDLTLNQKHVNINPNNYKYVCLGFVTEFLKALKERSELNLPKTATRSDEWAALFDPVYCPKSLASYIDNLCIRTAQGLSQDVKPDWNVLDSLITGKITTSPIFK